MQERFQTFTLLIAKINRSIRRIKTETMSEFNLKCPHVSCLYYLFKEGPLTSTELCEICDEDKSSVSRSLEYLEDEGYVYRNDNEGKVYKTPLRLSEKGKNVGKYISDKIDDVLNIASAGLSDDDRKIMYDSLGVVCKNLEKISCNCKNQPN